MKKLLLNPRQALYTEDVSDSRTISGALEIAKEIKHGGKIREPVYVMAFSEFPNRYALFNGNRRTKAAELRHIPLNALVIQDAHDFELAQRDQPTSWHRLEEEDFLRFNGDYFSKDFDMLRRVRLSGSPYQRARTRIKEAVQQFYSWL